MPDAEVKLDPTIEVIAACHDPLKDAWAELEAKLSAGLIDALRQAAGRHADAVASLGLEGEPPDEQSVRAERLLDYRRAVDSEMLEPLTRALEHFGPADSIEAALSKAVDDCWARCAALDEEAVALWPAGGLAPRPSDRLRRRIGKAFARAISAARKAGEPRTIRLRSLAQRHLASVVVPGQDEAAARATHAWAAWAKSLELAWIEWGDVALPALVRAEAPEGHDGHAEELWQDIREAARTLQTRLQELIEGQPRAEATAPARAALDEALGTLEADLAVAGSFLLRPAAVETKPTLVGLGKMTPALEEWDEGVAARVRVYRSLLSILSGATAVQMRLVWRVREKCLSRIGELPVAASKLEELRAELLRGEGAGLGARMGGLEAIVAGALEPALQAIPAPAVVDKAIGDVSDSTVEALLAVVRQAPAELRLHAHDAKPPAGSARPELRVLALQELARQSFDALRIERIRSSASGLVQGIDDTRGDVTGLPEVFAFAHAQAVGELEEGGEEAAGRALDLVTGALKSMAELLRAQLGDLQEAVQDAQARLATEITEGSLALLDRVGAGRMQAQLFAARSRVTDLFVRLQEAAAPPARRAWRLVKVWRARARALVLGLMRKGSALVGGSQAVVADSTRAVRTFGEAEDVIEALPLVYQRLFTLAPLSEAALMVGRAKDLENAMLRWRRWHSDEGVPLIVRARHGSGITSFMNVFCAHIEESGGKVVRIALNSRISDEAELAKALAEPLGLSSCCGLDELAHTIFEAGSSALPGAVCIDNLEHVYMRIPKGTDLLERLLTLMAETEPQMFWIGGVNSTAWQLVAAAEPTAVSQMDVYDLRPMDADAFREAIVARHRRSGLEVRYEEPTAGRHLLKRRLKRIRDAHRHQEVVEEDFFDHLYRASDGYLGLALFQWLLCADFSNGDGVTIRYPEKPDFSMLEVLDLTQNFTLKAFLEHRTLSLSEHDRIFRLPRHESYQIIESLRNRHLIEPVRDADGDVEHSEIEEDLRYRVRPLLVGPVISHLRGRNIVH